jgi:NTE family protein
VTTRAFDILSANTNTQKFNICEWLIEPTELSMYSTFEMNKAKMDIILKSVTKRPEPPLKNLIYKN